MGSPLNALEKNITTELKTKFVLYPKNKTHLKLKMLIFFSVYFFCQCSETVRARASKFLTQVDGITSQCIRKKYYHWFKKKISVIVKNPNSIQIKNTNFFFSFLLLSFFRNGKSKSFEIFNASTSQSPLNALEKNITTDLKKKFILKPKNQTQVNLKMLTPFQFTSSVSARKR